MADRVTTRPKGVVDDYLGWSTWDGLLADVREHVPDLAWPVSVQTYSRMRHDPKIAGVLAAITHPIRGTTYRVDPGGASDAATRAVADALGLPVVGQPTGGGGAWARSPVVWADWLRLALEHLVYGYAAFEQWYTIRDGEARLGGLAERLQDTIAEVRVDESTGRLIGVTQSVAGAIRPDAPLLAPPGLVWLVNDRRGAAWWGSSILRGSYGPWLLKHEAWRTRGISDRRWAAGVPVVTPPAGATDADLHRAQQLASALRSGDQAGVALPHGWTLSVSGITGTVPDSLDFARYLDQQISASTLTGLLDLGQTATGSRALGQTLLDLLVLSLQSIADYVAAEVTAQIAAPLTATNEGDDAAVPRVVAGDVAARREVTAGMLTGLIQVGAITPDPGLEAWLRDAGGLPATPPASPSPEARGVAAAAAPVDPTVAAAAAAHERALVELRRVWVRDITPVWVADLAVQARETPGPTQLTPPPTAPAQVVLAAAMNELARAAAAAVVTAAPVELLVPPLPVVDPTVVTVIVGLLAGGLAGYATEILLTQPQDASPEQRARAVRTAVAQLGDRELTEKLGAALWQATTAGRLEAAERAVTAGARLRADETLDERTCGPCREIDGRTLSPVEARRLYPAGGYIRCEGRWRCRGTVSVTWPERTRRG